MTDLIQQLLSWVNANPHWAGLAVLLVACAESLAVVGLVVPGAAMMFGAGALIAAGAMGFWTTLLLAVAGAVLGDGLSYWLGYRYNDKICQWWPFSRHPGLLRRGEAFFHHHGGKSVFVARFVGPVRPIVPMMAGMMAMSPSRFFLANILSALAWAPIYLLLGMAFGASLTLAGEVAGRLAVLMGVVLIALWATVRLVHVVYDFMRMRGLPWAEAWLQRGRSYPALSWVVGDLLDAQKPVLRTLLLWLAILLGGGWLFFWVLHNVMSGAAIVPAGQSLYELLQGLRTPIGDQVMVAFSELGDGVVMLILVVGVLLWMLWKKAWYEALYWLAAAGFAVLAVWLFKYTLQIPRPIALYSGVNSYSFPSGHAALSTAIYGYLAMLSAQALPSRYRWLPYAVAMLLVVGISFSRLYLGAHWLADVLGGIGLGAAWVALLAIARHYHLRRVGGVKGLPVVVLLLFLVVGSFHINNKMTSDLARYAVQQVIVPIPEQAWWQTAWRDRSAFRIDLEGEREQPLNIQWAGDLSALQQLLEAQGWRVPESVTASSALRWLSPDLPLAQLPVLPQLHNGQQEGLLLLYVNSGQTVPMVLRLWSSNIRLEPGSRTLWLGTVSGLRRQCLSLICFPRSATDYDRALAEFEPMLSAVEWKLVDRASVKNDQPPPVAGQLLLVR